MKKMKHTIATTINDPAGYDYRDYVDYCEMNGVEAQPDGSDDFLDWVDEEVRINWEEDIDNIRMCKDYNVPVVICGTLGLWDGRHRIAPVRVDSVYQAIRLCSGRDIEDVEVVWNDGVIMVYAHHHDGCNIFEISALNKKGQAKKYADYKPHDVKKLPYLYNI